MINDNCLILINNVPEGTHVYYDKRRKVFVIRKSSNYESCNIILAPCSYLMKNLIWEEFYALLNEEELEIANSYPYRRGFFDYLKETGLYETYLQAEENVITKEFDSWVVQNNINVTYALEHGEIDKIF
jgi:hypothetical protein